MAYFSRTARTAKRFLKGNWSAEKQLELWMSNVTDDKGAWGARGSSPQHPSQSAMTQHNGPGPRQWLTIETALTPRLYANTPWDSGAVVFITAWPVA